MRPASRIPACVHSSSSKVPRAVWTARLLEPGGTSAPLLQLAGLRGHCQPWAHQQSRARILANFSPAKTQIPRRCAELFLSLLCTILSLVSRNCIGTRGPCKLQFTRTKSNPQSDSESNEINRIAFFILRQDWETRPSTAPVPLVSHPFRETIGQL